MQAVSLVNAVRILDLPDDRPSVSLSLVFASIIGLWATYFALVTLRAYMIDLPNLEGLFEKRLLSTLCGMSITFALWLLLRLFDLRPLWLKILAALVLSMPTALLSAQVNTFIFSELQETLDREALEQSGVDEAFAQVGSDAEELLSDSYGFLFATERERLVDFTFSRYFMMLAWCALYLALLVGEKARLAERREQQFRNAARAAELKSLRYQVNPHFLFNTLNSLSALVLTGKAQAAEKMIHLISTFYRRSLADDPTADVTLAEEVALQKLYLEIEAVRFPLRLVAQYDIPVELENALIPGMILQPLIENSVKHAVAPSSGQVTIVLAAREEYGRLVVSVSDNGAHVADRDDTRPGFGIGLANVRERLEARFGNEASVVSGNVPGGYVTHLRLPLLRMGRRVAA